ncbi:MAG: rhodanese-like domain-containing protein [Nitrospirae bacterium]|nr:rhodanese-like domain-containing protein [Nitrospirota bacterium]MCL5978104.1 rhodanese-like domain-containing protein [Nitrospirota bacterium]
MVKVFKWLLVFTLIIFVALPVFAQDDIAKKMNDVMIKGTEEGHWQVNADEVYMWIKTKQADFLVVDVRPNAKAYKEGHIPGAIHIPYNEILTPENLKKLPKDKKIVLVCATGQLQNLPVVPLRMLGYDAGTLGLGYAAWIKGSAGGEQMKAAIKKANSKNYPVEK